MGFQDDDFEVTSPEIAYDKILEVVKPVDNIGCISDDIIRDMLSGFDYRNANFQRKVDSFSNDMIRLSRVLLKSTDRVLLAVTAIVIYVKTTDINQKAVNNLINSICSMNINMIEHEPDIKSEINLMVELFKNNVIGSKSLSMASSSQMMDVISSADDLLGLRCTDSSSVENRCTNSYMRSPKELGIKVDTICRLNQAVIDNTPVNPNDLRAFIESLNLDANLVDFDKFKPTIYDISNIRFCWFFHEIFQMILNVDDDESGKERLNAVIGCLLKTDKEFMGLDYNFLTLVEMALNCLSVIVDGWSYYCYIRAKKLIYHDAEVYITPTNAGPLYNRVRIVQKKVLQSLKECESCNVLQESNSGMQGVDDIFSSAIIAEVQKGNIGDNKAVLEAYVCECAMQLSALDEELQHFTTQDTSDVRKLLGESFKLSTMLDKERSLLETNVKKCSTRNTHC